MSRILACLLCLCCLVIAHAAEEPVVRIGSAGSLPDPQRYDERFPEMAEWAKAGVSGGIPEVERVVGRVRPGEDLAAAIATADVAADRPGVLAIEPGTYPFSGVLKLKPGLVLRGLDRQETILASTLDEATSTYGVGEKHAVEMASGSALEDLTLRNQAVFAIPEKTYQGKYDNPGAPKSGLIRFGGKVENAWVQRCDLTHAGSNPVSIAGSHLTLRDCLIAKAHNKGGKGHGYLELGGASHILFYNCEIRDIRHVSIMWKSRYVVVYGCRLNVDINFHDGLPERCLVEKTTIERRGGHHWSPICYGWEPWQDVGPGPRNFLWNNDFDGAGGGDAKVWILRDTTPGYANMDVKKPMELEFGPPPAHGTLYAVTGKDVPYSEVLKAKNWEELNLACKAGRWAIARDRAVNVKLLFPQGGDEYRRAVEVLAEIEQRAATTWEQACARGDPDRLRAWFATWGGTDEAARARTEAADLAAAAYAEIGGDDATAYKLKAYVQAWHGVAPIPDAVATFDAFAAKVWEREGDRLAGGRELQRFIARWPHTPSAALAEKRLVGLLREALDGFVARRESLSRRKREAIVAQFADTPLAAEAERRLLGD